MQCSHGRAVSRLSAGAGVTGVNGGDLLRVVKDEICRFGPWPDQMITRNTINLNRKKKQAEIDVKEVSEYRNILDFMMDVKKASRPGGQTPAGGPSASWPSALRAQSGPSFNGHCDGDLNLQ